MSVTQHIIRNALIRRYNFYSGRIITGTSSSGRALHSLSSVRLKVLDRDFCRRNGEYGCGLVRNVVPTLIITRNESTTSDIVLGTSLQGGSNSAELNPDATLSSNSNILIETDNPITLSTSQSNAEVTSSQLVEATTTSVESAQASLLFESIPEPPAIPVNTPAEELVNALGEPTFASLGLGGWTPSGMVQQCLEIFHVNLGMPWWATILTGTIIVRAAMFPLVLKSQRNAARMQNNMPEMQVLQMKMTEARQTGNALLAAKYGQDMMVFMKEKDINPLKNMMVPLAMAPVFISFFFGLRKMANLPVESLKEGGLFWFTDLTIADPYYLLPLITSVTVWITLELGVDGVKLNSAQHGNLIKYALRGIPLIMFPFTMNFPTAILCYWASSNAISLVQVSIMKLPGVREKLKIESAREIPKNQLPGQKKGFKESFKDSWTNMKITRELEDRQRYDEISFKRAGKGPIPKTYKYDPTKVTNDSIAAVQAKRKE